MREIAFADLARLGHKERGQLLQDYGALLIREMSTDSDSLRALGGSLGTVLANPAGDVGRENIEPGGIHLVRALEVPLKDQFGNVVLSTSDEAFPLHTDQFFRAEPADLVAMLCCEASAQGGLTLLSDVRRVAESLSPEQTSGLTKAFVRAPFGHTSILRPERCGHYQVAYNRYEIDKCCRTLAHEYSPEECELMASFESWAALCSYQISLGVGDCLVLDNKRFLHGRTAITPGSQRLIKRLRVSVAT